MILSVIYHIPATGPPLNESRGAEINDSTSILHPPPENMFYGEEENEWEQLDRTSWNGLKLTDPVKSVEVRLPRLTCKSTRRQCNSTRTNGFFYPPS